MDRRHDAEACHLSQVVGWMARGSGEKYAGLPAKGRIAPGFDADFCIFAPDESFVVEPQRLQHRHPVTPYAGQPPAGGCPEHDPAR